MNREDLRQPAKITHIRTRDEDHGIDTVIISLEGGVNTNFGYLSLKNALECLQFLTEVAAIFDIKYTGPGDLIGRDVIVLLTDSNYGSEGLENPKNGKRFTIRGFRKRHYPKRAPTPTEAKREFLKREIAWAERRVAETKAALAALEASPLIDWDDPNA